MLLPLPLHSCRYLSLAQAQDRALKVDWTDPINRPVRPSLIGAKSFMSFPIEDVLDYIDWNPFFQVRQGAGAMHSLLSVDHRRGLILHLCML